MVNSSNLSNAPHDYIEIVFLIEDKLDEQDLEEDLNKFKSLRYYFEKYYCLMKHIDRDLFLKRAALMTLDEDAYLYLSDIDINELKHLVNDIAPEYHPLMKAVRRGDYIGVEYLLKNDADPNAGTEPWFPLQQADLNKDKKMIEILERNGAIWEKCLRVYQAWRKKPYERRTGQ